MTLLAGKARVTLLAMLMCPLLWQPFDSHAAVPALDVVSRAESVEIDRLVRDVCRKDIVLLGEDVNHGGARTFEIKTEIMQRLIARCGFGAVLFESQLYDVLDYEHAVTEGTATPEQLGNAIGALWARSQESAALIAYLHGAITSGRVRVGGIDPQVGGVMGEYSKLRLGDALTAVLPGASRDACKTEIDRHNTWRYDEDSPFDDAAQQRLRGCVDQIRTTITAQGDAPASGVAAMAAAYARYLDMALEGDGHLRDIGMYEALRWHRSRWPTGTKVIVWCATVHAAKTTSGLAADMRPMGGYVHAAFGERAAVVGFTAWSGQYGNPGAVGLPHALSPALPESLESAVLADSSIGLRYVSRKRLKTLGTIAARPINYRVVHAVPWADVLDGLVVLREERAVERVR